MSQGLGAAEQPNLFSPSRPFPPFAASALLFAFAVGKSTLFAGATCLRLSSLACAFCRVSLSVVGPQGPTSRFLRSSALLCWCPFRALLLPCSVASTAKYPCTGIFCKLFRWGPPPHKQLPLTPTASSRALCCTISACLRDPFTVLHTRLAADPGGGYRCATIPIYWSIQALHDPFGRGSKSAQECT